MSLTALLAIPALAVEKPNLTGSWRLNPSKSDSHAAKVTGTTWVIDQKESALHVSEISQRADGKEVKTDFDCTTDGKECEFKLDGQAAKISFWFNGTVLVEMESRGSNRETIVEKKMRLSGDGKSMSVEYVPVAGGGQAGKMVFEKQ